MNRTFTYDLAGNMTSNSALGAYTYPAGGLPRPHAMTAIAGNRFTYDDNGNVLTGMGRSFNYDGENRPLTVPRPASPRPTFMGPTANGWRRR